VTALWLRDKETEGVLWLTLEEPFEHGLHLMTVKCFVARYKILKR